MKVRCVRLYISFLLLLLNYTMFTNFIDMKNMLIVDEEYIALAYLIGLILSFQKKDLLLLFCEI